MSKRQAGNVREAAGVGCAIDDRREKPGDLDAIEVEDPDTLGGLRPRQVALMRGGPVRYAAAVVLALHEEGAVTCDDDGNVVLGPRAAMEGRSPYRGDELAVGDKARELVLARLRRDGSLSVGALAKALRGQISAERASLRASGHLVLVGRQSSFVMGVVLTTLLLTLLVWLAASEDGVAMGAFVLPVASAGVTYLLRPGWHLADAALEVINAFHVELEGHRGVVPLEFQPRRWLFALDGVDPRAFGPLRGLQVATASSSGTDVPGIGMHDY